MGNPLLKFRILIGKCSRCKCKIPNEDLSNSIFGSTLICKRCRNEGYYEGRCPICNGGKTKIIEYRNYSFKEVQAMDDGCFHYLINDYRYQYQYNPETLIEKRNLICDMCHQFVFRENAHCPFCKEKQKIYKRE